MIVHPKNVIVYYLDQESFANEKYVIMKLNGLRPMIWVEDVKATMDFYTNILGFNFGHHLENWAWGFVTKDNVEIMFAKPGEHFPYHGMQFSGSFYIDTDDADGWWDKLKDKVEIVYPIENFEYNQREFAIKDCNGYIIQFGQEIEIRG